MAWNVDDEVEVRFGNATFFPAVVKVIDPSGWHGVDLDTPLPTLADCGLSSNWESNTTPMKVRQKVQCAACFITEDTNHHNIRDRS